MKSVVVFLSTVYVLFMQTCIWMLSDRVCDFLNGEPDGVHFFTVFGTFACLTAGAVVFTYALNDTGEED